MLFQFDTPLNRLLETAIVQRAAGKLVEAFATGNPAVFDANVAKPLARMLVPFTPVQAGSGDPSPSNVRPITGWTGVNIYHSGEDTSNPDTIPVVFPALGANLADNANGTIYNRTISTVYARWAVSDTAKSIAVKCKPNTTYCGKTFNSSMTIFRVGTIAVDPDESTSVQNIPLLQNEDVSKTKQFTITTDADAKYIVIQGNGTIISNRTGEIMVVEGSTMPTEYEPFTNTVYGGSLDLVSGVLTVEWTGKTYTGAESENWKTEAIGTIRNFYIATPVEWKRGTTANSLMCNVAKSSRDIVENTAKNSAYGNLNVCIGNAIGISNVADFKTWLGSNNLQIAVTLETPYAIQLDPVTIQTLIGTNTLWTDTNGTNEITYMQKG